MRAARPVLALALVGGLAVTAGVSDAAAKKKPAAKPVCNLVTDAKGDSGLSTIAPGAGNDATLDITSADIASDGKNITAVIRVDKLAASSATALNGYNAVFEFTPDGSETPLFFRYYTGSDAFDGSASYGYDDPTNGLTDLGDALAVVDTAKNEIRITTNNSSFIEQASLKSGAKIGTFSVTTSRDALVLLPYADIAETGSTYTIGAPSCVKPGK